MHFLNFVKTGVLFVIAISFTVQNSADQNLSTHSIVSKETVLKAASYLTEPVCKVRETFYTFYLIDANLPTTQKVKKIATLVIALIVYTALTPLTAPFGIVLRGLVSVIESKSYIYWKRASKGKSFTGTVTLLSYNTCLMPAGYCITDGQVAPPSDRMRKTVDKIKNLNPDIVCLYEVPDILDASAISSELSDYPFIIPVAGVRAIGPSSMMYVASKYEIVEDSIEFTPFAKGIEVTGRAQVSEKGFLSFDVKDVGNKQPFATVITTHLQHSEIPAKPQVDDVLNEPKARSLQMKRIAEKIRTKIEGGKNVIFTGDLNQAENELGRSLKEHKVEFLRRDENVRGKSTWDGDAWCAKLMGKEASKALVLDYTYVAGKNASIKTEICDVGYSGTEFRVNALSDHQMLFSTMTLSQ